MKTTWNLEQLYTSLNDPNIQKDLQKIDTICVQFEKKYKNTQTWKKSIPQLILALDEYEKMYGLLMGAKPLFYVGLLQHKNGDNAEANQLYGKVYESLTHSTNHIQFFELQIAQFDKSFQKKILTNVQAKKYHYFLEKIFALAEHNLSEAEEKISALKYESSHKLWVDGVSRTFNKQTLVWKGKEISISSAMTLMHELPLLEKRKLSEILYQKAYAVADFSESEMNAIVRNKMQEDTLRKFPQPYSSTVLRYENEEKTVKNLIEVCTEAFPLAHRFYKLKAKMHKLKKLEYSDRNAKFGKNGRKIEFKESVKLVSQIFSELDPQYGKYLETYLENGQIDAMPSQGKYNGAFCWTMIGSPTFVLLNYSNHWKYTLTLAHEMGHAIHGELSKTQSIIYQSYSTSVAETASTFFESLALDVLLKTFSAKEKTTALHDKISDDINTIFRQIACFNFEEELHQQIRKTGYLPKEAIAEIMNKHMQSYLGSAVHIKKEAGYSFVYWPHIREFFYVYSYAFGLLISKALLHKYKQDPKFKEKIRAFLSAGCNMSPENIFASIGIDIRSKKFFQEGIKEIENDINELEKLLKNKK